MTAESWWPTSESAKTNVLSEKRTLPDKVLRLSAVGKRGKDNPRSNALNLRSRITTNDS
jgi:hypothetical protein